MFLEPQALFDGPWRVRLWPVRRSIAAAKCNSHLALQLGGTRVTGRPYGVGTLCYRIRQCIVLKEQDREAYDERNMAIEENAEGVHVDVGDENLC